MGGEANASVYADKVKAATTGGDVNSIVTNSGGTTKATTSETGSSNRNTTDVSSTVNMTPEALASLQLLIQQLQGGGTNEQLAERAKRQQTQDLIAALMGQYSKGSAMEDAKGLMALNVQKAMEQNMPAIQRAIEGSGTSASSMQALLAQNLARDSALSASALGAEQAKSYGQIQASLGSTMEAATRQTNPVTDALLRALGISKGAVENTSRTVNDSFTSSGTRATITDSPETTITTDYGNSSIPDNLISSGSSLAAERGYAPLDMNTYYSNLRRSGSGETLYDFLTNSQGGIANGL